MKKGFKKQYNVAIIGLGGIGLGFDIKHKKDFVLTHTKAFMSHPGFNLVYGIDINSSARKSFELFSNKKAYTVIDDIDINEIDVFVLALYPEDRDKVIKKILKAKPKIILLEKPVGNSKKEAKYIIDVCKKQGISLGVNYIRRFDPAVLKIKKDIKNKKFGKPVSSRVIFSGGVLGNASHFLDLLIFLLGKPKAWDIIPGEYKQNAKNMSSIFFDFWISFKLFRSIFQSITVKDYSICSLEIVFEKGILYYDDFGRDSSFRWVENDPNYIGYKHLNKKRVNIPIDLEHGLWYTADSIYKHLKKGDPIHSTGETSLESLIVCENLINKWKKINQK